MLEDPRARAHEQRAIAVLHESLGSRRSAIAAIEGALDLVPDDVTLAHELDRLLALESLTPRRVELWVRQGAATQDGPERARRLVRAARLAESQGDGARAADLLRAALVAQPADDEATDALLRLSVAPPAEHAVTEVRARIGVHAHAAEHAVDPARRVAHLEAMALLEEEMLGAPGQAKALYEAILRLEPGRRGAVVGLARTAARAGDVRTLSFALLEEAKATADPTAADLLRIRAAEALALIEEEQALAIARDVLSRSPGHEGALSLAQRLHEAAGRWPQVDLVLAARIARGAGPELANLWVARAEVQRARLKAPAEALASLRAALAIDPRHPVAREALALLLEAQGDAGPLCDGLADLARGLVVEADRARGLVRAGEVAELVLLDDARADELYRQALAALPGDPWIEGRRHRVLLRRARAGHAAELHASLEARVSADPGSTALAFELAISLLDDGGAVARATALVDGVLAKEPLAAHAVRTLERVARATGAAPLLANALAQQADAFAADAPKVAALWAEAALVEWKLGGDARKTIERILPHAPTDRAALDAAIVRAAPRARARRGIKGASARALGARAAQASGDTERLYLELALALLLEPDDDGGPAEEASPSLVRYREALHIDPHSVLAASGTSRLGGRLGDAEAIFASAIALADCPPTRSAAPSSSSRPRARP